jgi:hypothetical protein
MKFWPSSQKTADRALVPLLGVEEVLREGRGELGELAHRELGDVEHGRKALLGEDLGDDPPGLGGQRQVRVHAAEHDDRQARGALVLPHLEPVDDADRIDLDHLGAGEDDLLGELHLRVALPRSRSGR